MSEEKWIALIATAFGAYFCATLAVMSWRDTHFLPLPLGFGFLATGLGYGSVRVGVSMTREFVRSRSTRLPPPQPPIDPYRAAAEREVEGLLTERSEVPK